MLSSSDLFPGLFHFSPHRIFYSTAIFQHFFGQTHPDGRIYLLRPSRDCTIPELTSNTIQRLLFHGCVWSRNRSSAVSYTDLLAVCIFLRATHNLLSVPGYKICTFEKIAVKFSPLLCAFRGGTIQEEEVHVLVMASPQKAVCNST